MLKYLIVCPLVFIAGFVDAIAGGGGLITLPAYVLAGLPYHQAVATNKMSSTMGTFTSTYRYIRMGYVPFRLAIPCVIFAIIGSNLGARLFLSIDDQVLKYVMLVLLPVTAFFVLKEKTIDADREPLGKLRTLVIASLTALVIGAYDGFYGPGSGTFLLFSLTVFAHLKLTEANGITKVINFSSNIAALIVYLINGQPQVMLGLAAGFFSIAGNYFGAGAFGKKGARIARPVMLCVIGLFFVKVVVEMLNM